MSVQTDRDGELAESEIFHILGNDRRRAIVSLLADRRERVEVSEIATAIAERESETAQVPNNLYKSVYVSLQQTHLPQLEEDDVIVYDAEEKTIRPGPHFEEVRGYIESAESAEDHVLLFSLAVAVGGLVAVILSGLGLPLVTAVDPLLWGVVSLLAVAVACLYGLLG
ncbi:ArsR family transcriptional regulator [Halovivax sp.]|uniref:DUF7344 domain-containing protein n=1 Tax=Halovivax sp. TaxID=1935978 RepID=UPI0025B9322F|nr:ArsR family transcriptional regulator [Halovivax sp.]